MRDEGKEEPRGRQERFSSSVAGAGEKTQIPCHGSKWKAIAAKGQRVF